MTSTCLQSKYLIATKLFHFTLKYLRKIQGFSNSQIYRWNKDTITFSNFIFGDVKTQLLIKIWFFSLLWRCGPIWAMASSFLRFLDHTQRRTTFGRTPLEEWSARRSDPTPTWQHTTLARDRHPCSQRDSYPQSQQTHALVCADTGTGRYGY